MTVIRAQLTNTRDYDGDYESKIISGFQTDFVTDINQALQDGWVVDPSNFNVVFANGFFSYFNLVFRKL